MEPTRKEQLKYMARYLICERHDASEILIPHDEQEIWELVRSLMNVRPPDCIDDEFLQVQDSFLTAETQRRGVVRPFEEGTIYANGRIVLWQGDITRLAVGAIVNAANSALLGCFIPCHGCIDNAIHSNAGVQLRLKCRELMERQQSEEPTGRAKITPGYNLPCDYIIHTVGPIIYDRLTKEQELLLADCYRSCLSLALQSGIDSIAFCCISTGEFRFPPQRAAEIAIETVKETIKDNDIKVIFNVFKQSDYEIYRRLLGVFG